MTDNDTWIREGIVIPISTEMLTSSPVLDLAAQSYGRREPVEGEVMRDGKPEPVRTGSDSFDRAVRAMVRRKGHDVPDHAKVTVEMTGEWSGYSEYTITNQWDEFTIHVEGVAEPFVYDTDWENRQWRADDIDQSPKAALAKLWDDLMGDEA